jgi:hypothetical protein
MTIVKLPLSIFGLIREYFVVFSILENDDLNKNLKNWRDFCNCSKAFFEIKGYYSYYNLNRIYSAVYIVYNDPNCKWIRNVKDFPKYTLGILNLQKRIRHPQNQIFLSFTKPDSSFDIFQDCDLNDEFVVAHQERLRLVHSIIWRRRSSLCDVSFCSKYIYVNLEGSHEIIDISSLSNVKYLILGHCTNVREVSSLKNLLEIDLSFTLVEDVSSLGNIKKLSLRDCPEVKDVSNLKALQWLSLCSCTGVEDISFLHSVKVLDIAGMSNLKKKLPQDNIVTHLRCSTRFIEEVYKYTNKNKSLEITGQCTKSDLEFLDGYPELKLRYTDCAIEICDVTFLCSLWLGYSSNFIRFCNLPNLQKLHLEGESKYTAVPFPTIEYETLPLLHILSFEFIKFAQMIVNPPVQKLKLAFMEVDDIYLSDSLLSLQVKDTNPFISCHLYIGKSVQKIIGQSSVIHYVYEDTLVMNFTLSQLKNGFCPDRKMERKTISSRK